MSSLASGKLALTDERLLSHKKKTYRVIGVGLVQEEVMVKFESKGENESRAAIHRVFIDGRMVREKNLITGKVSMCDSQYEPFDFLRLDSTMSGAVKGETYIPIEYVECENLDPDKVNEM